MNKTSIDLSEALRIARSESRIKALLNLRQTHGLGLKEAWSLLHAALDGVNTPNDDEVFLDAELIATGLFSSEIEDCLDYPAQYYANVRVDTPVIVHLFDGHNAEARGLLAACFHVDVWDFNGHQLDYSAADKEALTQLLSVEEVHVIRRLVDAGFLLWFYPGTEGQQ